MRKIKIFLNRGDLDKTLIGYVDYVKGNVKGYDINNQFVFEGRVKYVHHKEYKKFLLHSYNDIKRGK